MSGCYETYPILKIKSKTRYPFFWRATENMRALAPERTAHILEDFGEKYGLDKLPEILNDMKTQRLESQYYMESTWYGILDGMLKWSRRSGMVQINKNRKIYRKPILTNIEMRRKRLPTPFLIRSLTRGRLKNLRRQHRKIKILWFPPFTLLYWMTPPV